MCTAGTVSNMQTLRVFNGRILNSSMSEEYQDMLTLALTLLLPRPCTVCLGHCVLSVSIDLTI